MGGAEKGIKMRCAREPTPHKDATLCSDTEKKNGTHRNREAGDCTEGLQSEHSR